MNKRLPARGIISRYRRGDKTIRRVIDKISFLFDAHTNGKFLEDSPAKKEIHDLFINILSPFYVDKYGEQLPQGMRKHPYGMIRSIIRSTKKIREGEKEKRKVEKQVEPSTKKTVHLSPDVRQAGLARLVNKYPELINDLDYEDLKLVIIGRGDKYDQI
jgi:hypothetical protein